MLDLIIRGGLVPDFATGEMKAMDVGVKDGKIHTVGTINEEALRTVDATGKAVAPGFIDIHMHEEDFPQEGNKYVIADMMLQMGVTTCLGGNCGVQHQPVAEFRKTIDALGGAPVNYLLLAGYNEYREKRLGISNYEEATKAQKEELRKILLKELADGAWGISLGIEYAPGMSYEECLYALEAIGEAGDLGCLASAHYRSDATESLDAIEEMIRLARESGTKFQISHLSSCSAMGQMAQALAMINRAIDENPRLNYDTYPYDAFSTHIGSAVFDEGCMERWNKDYDCVLLTAEPFKNQRCTKEIFEIARRDYPDMLAVTFAMEPGEIRDAITNRYGMVASDAIIAGGKGHPRAAGTFPRVLGKYVREEKALSLVEALRKMTLEPAERLELNQKGQIKEGMDADITVFDPETILDGANFETLDLPPVGIDMVLIGGQVAMEDGKIVNGRLGRFYGRTERV